MTAYYNDNEPFVCAWMQNLMDAGLITRGKIDSRPIQEIKPDEIKDYTRCNFFAGIAGWDYALQLAGWPDDRPVWTASLPCQPFSVAGRQKAERDDRHLWPVFYDLVRECRPVTIFGEQVEAAVRLGWIDRVRTDLDRAGYSFGFVVLGAHSVGAPHIRQRIYWVADCQRGTEGGAYGRERGVGRWEQPDQREGRQVRSDVADSGIGGGVGDADRARRRERRGAESIQSQQQTAEHGSAWSGGQYIRCADGKTRLIEPSICPLAHGVPNRVGQLRGAGNAIVPQVAAEFIRAFMETGC